MPKRPKRRLILRVWEQGDEYEIEPGVLPGLALLFWTTSR
jgi:hypothetical protein